jgi:hypothetical protein
MINYSNLFVIFKEDGSVRLLGSTADLGFIEANLKPGDTYNWGDQIAKDANGIFTVVTGDQLELNII